MKTVNGPHSPHSPCVRPCLYLVYPIFTYKLEIFRIYDLKYSSTQLGNRKVISPLVNLKGMWAYFKVTLHVLKWQCPIYNVNRINMWKITLFFLHKNWLVSLSFSIFFVKKPQMKHKQFKDTKTWIVNSYLIRQSYLRVPLWIGNCHLCIRCDFKLNFTGIV